MNETVTIERNVQPSPMQHDLGGVLKLLGFAANVSKRLIALAPVYTFEPCCMILAKRTSAI